jgi:transposase
MAAKVQSRGSARSELVTERLGPLPLLNHFLDRLGVEAVLEKFVPTTDRRASLSHARALGVLLRSIVVEREPIYRQQETVETFAARTFGLSQGEVGALRDDRIGRALDRLFDADRATMATELVVALGERFGVELSRLHNDTTSVKLTGQYAGAKGRSIRGRKAPWITYGYSKDHRPDLKQLVLVLCTSEDGGLPVLFRCESGNTNDASTHVATWDALCRVAGNPDFLYVADSKLCGEGQMDHIDRRKGRFVTVLPRSRKEDAEFRKGVQDHEPPWERVVDRPNPRRRHGPRDRWYVWRASLPSRESWPVTWVFSELLALRQETTRRENLGRAEQELQHLRKRLDDRRPRAAHKLQQRVERILARRRVARYLRVDVGQEAEHEFRQEHRGRPGPDTRYRRHTRQRWKLSWKLDEAAVAYDRKSDGMYPLLTNDRSLTPAQVLAAHKGQPTIEKRFEQWKTVHEIAPVFLKNEDRIEALFFLYWIALLVQALVERELRNAMRREGIREIALYPEERQCRRPTTQQVLRLFSHVARHVVTRSDGTTETFEPVLTELQTQLLNLLQIPPQAFKNPA